MGRGSYRATDWAALRSSRKLSGDSTEVQIFDSKAANASNRSNYIKLRESRDNPDSPRSTPVIIGFDVTASMGYLAKEIATNSLNNMISQILANKAVTDPQVLCAAIGDVKSDKYPLQVTQFESDIRMVRQLMTLCLEGGGGGNDGESYNLLWYFASRHTSTDCHEKRHKKGLLFTIGDDKCHADLSRSEIFNAFGDNVRVLGVQYSGRYHVSLVHGNNYLPRCYVVNPPAAAHRHLHVGMAEQGHKVAYIHGLLA